MRTLVIGDVHGCGIELQFLLKQEKIEPGVDRVFLVGDCFDRAKHSHLVWELIQKYHIRATLGNHEVKFIKYLQGKRSADSLPPHYHWALNNLIHHGVKVQEFYDFLINMPLLIEIAPQVIVTHAGVNIDDPYVENEGANVYGNIVSGYRDNMGKMPRPKKGDGQEYWWDRYKGNARILYGHLVCENNVPRHHHNSIGLDTAACHGGPLTGYIVEEDRAVSYKSGYDWHGELKSEFLEKKPIPHPVVVGWIAKNKSEWLVDAMIRNIQKETQ